MVCRFFGKKKIFFLIFFLIFKQIFFKKYQHTTTVSSINRRGIIYTTTVYARNRRGILNLRNKKKLNKKFKFILKLKIFTKLPTYHDGFF